jgi:putative addiction module component (TIGR02574 family)
MDKKLLLDEINRLPPHERMDIVESLLDGVAFDDNPPSVTPEQLRELDARLEHHRRHPDEPGVTLQEIRRKLFPG